MFKTFSCIWSFVRIYLQHSSDQIQSHFRSFWDQLLDITTFKFWINLKLYLLAFVYCLFPSIFSRRSEHCKDSVKLILSRLSTYKWTEVEEFCHNKTSCPNIYFRSVSFELHQNFRSSVPASRNILCQWLVRHSIFGHSEITYFDQVP